MMQTSEIGNKLDKHQGGHHYSVLENGARKAAGLDIMPHWQEGLRRYLGLASS